MGRRLALAVGQGGLVVGAGVLFALAANSTSPAGIRLDRNYFPAAQQPVLNAAGGAEDKLRGMGLSALGLEEAREWFADPDRLRERIVFVDVRSAEIYAAGHVPDAYHFDYYHPEQGLAGTLAACRTAEKVAVYCNGGDCEDSAQAARLLIQGGVPEDRIRVFVGGFAEWEKSGGPVETGQRSSGMLKGGGQ